MKTDLHFTPSAIAYIKRILQDTPDALGIRLGVKTTGCSGLSYVVDVAKELRERDQVFQVGEDLQVVINLDSLSYLKGMEVDCQAEGLNEGLKFNNPNAKAACGCGESFIV